MKTAEFSNGVEVSENNPLPWRERMLAYAEKYRDLRNPGKPATSTTSVS